MELSGMKAHRADIQENDEARSPRGKNSTRLALALSAVFVCVSLVIVAVTSGGSSLSVLQQDTTFVWETPSQAEPTLDVQQSRSQKLRHFRADAGRGWVGRGRLAATRSAAQNPQPLGFDIAKTLDASFRRGEMGSESLIHIDLPIEQYQLGKTIGGGKANMLPSNVDGTGLHLQICLFVEYPLPPTHPPLFFPLSLVVPLPLILVLHVSHPPSSNTPPLPFFSSLFTSVSPSLPHLPPKP